MSAYTVYLVLSAASAFCFSAIVTVDQVYFVETVGLNPLQLVLLGTVLEGSIFLFEVPTGVVADVFSRRLSVIIGMFLIGAGFFLEGWVSRFDVILLAQVVWGVGYTFTSGAKEAWIADEIGEERSGRAYMRGAQWSHIGGLLGIGGGVMLGQYDLRLPILAGGGLYALLGGFLILFMPERGFKPASREDRSSWRAMAGTVQQGIALVRERPALLTIFAISLCYGMFTESFDRLWTPYLLKTFTFPDLMGFKPVVWFGIIHAVGLLFTIGALNLVNRRVDPNHQAGVIRGLMAINAVIMAGILIFLTTGRFSMALAALWAVFIARRVQSPLMTVWLNQHVASHVRATVFSMHNQMDAIGQVAGGPALGAIATASTIPTALLIGVCFLIPAFYLYGRTETAREESATGRVNRR